MNRLEGFSNFCSRYQDEIFPFAYTSFIYATQRVVIRTLDLQNQLEKAENRSVLLLNDILHGRGVSEFQQILVDSPSIFLNNLWLVTLQIMLLVSDYNKRVKIGLALTIIFARVLIISRRTSKVKTFTKRPNDYVIPDRWSSDPILKKFECPITKTIPYNPIKDPVAKKVIYDKNALAEWSWTNPKSPITRRPISIADSICRKAYYLDSLIRYRVKQLTELEQLSNRQLTSEDEVVINSARDLDENITNFLKSNPEEISKIPEFLSDSSLFDKCGITGKALRSPMIPRFQDADFHRFRVEKGEEYRFLSLFYEKDVITKHIHETPHIAPPNWPIRYFPLPLTMDYLMDEHRRKMEIELLIKQAQGEISNFYLST